MRMQIKATLTFLFTAILLAGCASNGSKTPSEEPKHEARKRVDQPYQITVVGTDGKPVEGAMITYSATLNSYDGNSGNKMGEETVTTDEKGQFQVILSSPRDRRYPEGLYYSEMSFTAYQKGNKKDAYTGKLSSLTKKDDIAKPVSTTVFLGKQHQGSQPKAKPEPSDPNLYFTDSFTKDTSRQTLRLAINEITPLLLAKIASIESTLNKHSIGIERFKSKNNITLGLKNLVVYNSLKSSKYDIGAKIFDEVIKPLLEPLNNHLSEQTHFDGFSFKIDAYTKSFLDKDSYEERIRYTFYLSKKDVASYKNLDITSQKLLDSSIILMNGDRIELTLH